MKANMLAIVLIGAGFLAGCAKAQPRAVEYFALHLDEANRVTADCRTGAFRGDECANADNALQQDAAKKRLKRFVRD